MANGRLADRDVLAFAAALSQPWADVVLSGAATVEQLRSNVDALRVVLDEAAVAALGALAQPVDAYWRQRRALAWT